MLKINNISKCFGDKQVLKNVSFEVPSNCIFGFIGQNGAGKTTTMKMILGLLDIDSGEIFVNGEKVVYGDNDTNKYIGYLPDVPEFYSYMTAKEYLQFCGEITGMDKSDYKERTIELLKLVGLEKEKHRIKGFSRGMKQRLGIAQALLNRPKLLICDEPTSALDPLGRKDILEILVAAKKETTVFFSTHILSDIEKICDRIAFLHEGEIRFAGSIEEVNNLGEKSGFEIELDREDELNKMHLDFPHFTKENMKLICEKGGEKQMEEIMKYILNNHISTKRIEKRIPTLETLFVEVVSK